MGKKGLTKKESEGIFWLVIIGIPIFLVYKLVESVGLVWISVTVVGAIALYAFYTIQQTNKRQKYLIDKYGDETLVKYMMKGHFWQEQTAEQLIDSLGRPHDIDQKVLKTKKKEVWKYNHQGGNRFGLRITLDNDVVVGWDQKS